MDDREIFSLIIFFVCCALSLLSKSQKKSQNASTEEEIESEIRTEEIRKRIEALRKKRQEENPSPLEEKSIKKLETTSRISQSAKNKELVPSLKQKAIPKENFLYKIGSAQEVANKPQSKDVFVASPIPKSAEKNLLTAEPLPARKPLKQWILGQVILERKVR